MDNETKKMVDKIPIDELQSYIQKRIEDLEDRLTLYSQWRAR